MTSYTATFKDGETIHIANSKKEYGAAYRIGVKWKPKQAHREPKPDADGYIVSYKQGFSRDRDLASKAAMSETASIRRGTYYAKHHNAEHNKISVDGQPGEIVFIDIVNAVKGV